MIIAINQQPYDGPWGGGNRFVQFLVGALVAAGHSVVHHLEGDIDIILMVETRVRSPNVTFGAGTILRYLSRHSNTLVVHRINECDERKGIKFITDKLLRANYAADRTVFVGSWLKDLPAWRDKPASQCATILNGADTYIFNSHGFVPWNAGGPMRLVTHHWGAHRFKGFDVYEYIDVLLGRSDFAAKFSMTYIGNLPTGFTFRNIRHITPLNGIPLADALREHHAYITASINEPGGNHQNEGSLCGLPIVYRNSGCMPEYCKEFGIDFYGPDDVEHALQHLYEHYDVYAEKIKLYPHTADKMANQWCLFFEDLINKRDEIIKSRNIWRNPYLFFRNQLPV